MWAGENQPMLSYVLPFHWVLYVLVLWIEAPYLAQTLFEPEVTASGQVSKVISTSPAHLNQ